MPRTTHRTWPGSNLVPSFLFLSLPGTYIPGSYLIDSNPPTFYGVFVILHTSVYRHNNQRVLSFVSCIVPPDLSYLGTQCLSNLFPPNQSAQFTHQQIRLLRAPQLLKSFDKLSRSLPLLLDLESLVASDALGAHQHFEIDISQSEKVGFGTEGSEGAVGYVVIRRRFLCPQMFEERAVVLRGEYGRGDDVDTL